MSDIIGHDIDGRPLRVGDEVMRSLLFLIWAFLIGRGIWVAVVMIKDPKQ